MSSSSVPGSAATPPSAGGLPASTDPAAPAAALQERIAVLSAQIHAAHAELARLTAELDSLGTWADTGVRTCAHWLSINTGVDLRTGSELVRTGHSLAQLPHIAAAFDDGRLSFDKVRAVTRVAIEDDEETWLHVALHATGPQLSRICRQVRQALDVDDPRRADDALAHRGVRLWWRDDGMLELMAVLPREDGALVMAAIEAASSSLAAEQSTFAAVPGHPSLEGALDPRPDGSRQPLLRADALVRVCEEWVASVSREPMLAPTHQVMVHVDAATLAGTDPAGRCHLEDGPWLSQRSAHWLSCDADIVHVVERDGLPIDVGRLRRLVPPRLRLALQARDQGCRFPTCSAPARRTQAHHIRHWTRDGGPTTLANLASLCRFHHGRHHEGRFDIRVLDGGELRFELPDGTPLVPVTPRAAEEPLPVDPTITAETPGALSGGAPCDMRYAVGVLADISARTRERPPG